MAIANSTQEMFSGSETPLPDSIIIVGGGVFGLSTALALSARHSGKITLIDSSPTIPNPQGSSVDTSRIVRADYANAAYAALAESALEKWRTTAWGHEGRYTQTGLVLVSSGDKSGKGYVQESYENVKATNPKMIEKLPTREDVERAAPGYGTGLHVSGGYVNWGSGWADAEASVRFAKKNIDEMGKVDFRTGEVNRLLVSTPPHPDEGQRGAKGATTAASSARAKVTGVELSDGTTITADLVILATGAWTGRLLDLRGKAEATGQALAYIRISDEEQAKLANMPTVLNLSTGMFIIPPRNNMLKIARHAYGYRNPQRVPAPVYGPGHGQTPTMIEVSLPVADVPLPQEGESACRAALKEMLPSFADRPFEKTRVCWYTDTPKGNFIITHHPHYAGLFLATGGSGHAFKFLPVLGEKIVDAIQGRLDPELQELWGWPGVAGDEDAAAATTVVWTEDGSRSGEKGLILMDELAKGQGGKRGSRL
ncbi:fructosyl amino acid oxidasesarcosine oxidase [Histoplasma capsulatum]|uniref:Fructosyl amino acid oxidasesarcosine oxidase n=1 Tax=Ajellomyces capsulatus TaxID=5037 RepID=A0A8A1ME40_AJECA|nr:conserved hypothetical protein [Histoplasma mississippiense (nom. inval.)]EDN02217.1 conserved hypothetical protein [Histoplasma mississippiense (nom. inval.)]QSS64766.1 fructosyl amino acid oxidasesarcosine oxidase [Histoplasma capsulatum]